MRKHYKITHATFDEIDYFVEWARKEGWNPGINDAACFYAADPSGYFVGKLDGEVIAMGSAVIYDKNYAFCGLYIVKPEYRTKGYGIKLTEARLEYVGNRITGLDGVLDMVDKYEHLGYVKAHNNVRYQLDKLFVIEPDSHITELTENHLSQLVDYDSQYFPAKRYEFLQSWITQPNAVGLAFIDHDHIRGYGVIRECYEGHKIGPLFAENSAIAELLFKSLVSKVNHGPVVLDIPEPNASAKALVDKYQMKKIFETIRMYRNGQPNIDLNKIYGITTFELG